MINGLENTSAPGNCNLTERKQVDIYHSIDGFFQEHVLLTTKSLDGKINTMPLTFKSIGNVLGDLCINIFVSQQRYTCEILETGIQEFTLSRGSELTPYIEKTGVTSGRNVDKIKDNEISMLPGITTEVPVMEKASMSYECLVVGSVEKNQFLGYKMFLGTIQGVFIHLP